MGEALLLAVLAAFIWKKVFFKHEIHIGDGHDLGILSMLTVLGMVWAVLASKFMESRLEKYFRFREAVMRHSDEDYETFILLGGEKLSPILHLLMGSISLVIMIAVMVIDYKAKLMVGYLCVGASAYVLALTVFVLVEVDNPLSGFWFVNIEDIPKSWLAISPRAARKQRFGPPQQDQLERKRQA